VNKVFVSLLLMCSTSVFSSEFVLKSKDLSEGSLMATQQVFNGFGCAGENISPELEWENAPQGTKSFAVTVYDPDAPTGSGWWHWLVVDIPASATKLSKGQDINLVKARAIKNDFGSSAYGGACPPAGHGMHRYQFTVWALDVEKLPLPEAPSAALVGFMLNSSSLARATITATYAR